MDSHNGSTGIKRSQASRSRAEQVTEKLFRLLFRGDAKALYSAQNPPAELSPSRKKSFFAALRITGGRLRTRDSREFPASCNRHLLTNARLKIPAGGLIPCQAKS